MNRGTLHSLVLTVWILLVVGATAALYTGQLESVVAPSDLPQSEVVMVGAPLSAVVLGLLVFWNRKSAAWKSMGRQAGLAPENGSVLPMGQPDLTGTVDGRDVRVRTLNLKTNSGSEGSSRSTYTVIETDLPEAATDGTMLTRTDSAGDDRFEAASVSVGTSAVGDRFGAAIGSENLAERVLTSPVKESLLALDTMELFLVGAASDAVSQTTPDVENSWLGSKMLDQVDEQLAGDASTVSHQIGGTLLDGGELERQVRAVVAVGDAFEAASGNGHESERSTAEPTDAP